MIAYTLIRSKRKTVSIRITRQAQVEVRAPLKVSKKELDRIVASKQEWIETHLQNAVSSLEAKRDFTLNYGDSVTFRGEEYRITKSESADSGFKDGMLYLPDGEIKPAVIRAYKAAAKAVFAEKAQAYAKLMRVTPTAIKVTSAKTHWGSCSGSNSINFSWRLVIASDDVIDYVVVHELAHIRQHNHSPQFWAIVRIVIPDYQVQSNKLKELQKKFEQEDWDLKITALKMN